MNTPLQTPRPTAIAIVDPCSAADYSPQTLAKGGLGGTEATVLRVTGALAQHVDIVHFQKGRAVAEQTAAGAMMPFDAAFTPHPGATFVVINSWKVAVKLRKSHPAARILLWLHIHPGRHNRPMAAALHDSGVDIICVSHSHGKRLQSFLEDAAPLRIDHIYNPIADDLHPDATPRNPDRLLFASSPHKGLAQVFAQFRAARTVIPTLTLEVADPGYLAWNTGPVPEGVVFLGSLPHDRLIARMRKALCLFYPQTTFAETFGIVLAEANAVGTPVLADRTMGANTEVVDDPVQLVDGRDDVEIIDRLQSWRTTAPIVGSNPAFRMDAVRLRWMEMLGLSATQPDVIGRVA